MNQLFSLWNFTDIESLRNGVQNDLTYIRTLDRIMKLLAENKLLWAYNKNLFLSFLFFSKEVAKNNSFFSLILKDMLYVLAILPLIHKGIMLEVTS